METYEVPSRENTIEWGAMNRSRWSTIGYEALSFRPCISRVNGNGEESARDDQSRRGDGSDGP